MGLYKVVAGQNIYDVALHLYGSIEGIVDLLMCNTDLSLDTTLRVGQEMVYSDDFVIDADVVAYNEMHGIVPSNGERRVYPKTFTNPLAALFTIPATLLNVRCGVSGEGRLEIDWGDNSDTETVELSNKQRILAHTFDNKVRDRRRIRWFTDARFRQVDWSGLQPTAIVLLRPLSIEELTLEDAALTLESLQMLTGTYSLNLTGLACDDLAPLAECRELMRLDLTGARIKPRTLDKYLIDLTEGYGNRRNCAVSLTTEPTGIYREPLHDDLTGRYDITSGMEAVWVILHESAWNEGGAWRFIINDKTYTVE